MRLVLFYLFFFLHITVHACDETSVICRTRCLSKGADIGIVLNSKCYCGFFEDISQFIAFKPNKNYIAKVTK